MSAVRRYLKPLLLVLALYFLVGMMRSIGFAQMQRVLEGLV